MSDLILYTSDDGQTRLNPRVTTDSVWLTQLEIEQLEQSIRCQTKNSDNNTRNKKESQR